MRYLVPVALLLGAACQRPVPATAPPATTPPPAALRETRWLLRQLGSAPVARPGAPNEREAYVRLQAGGNLEGFGGCNRLRASYQSPSPGQLSFGPIMSTRMACPRLSLETDFTNALAATRAYQISGDTLRLFGQDAGAPLAKLVAVYLR